MSRSAVNPQESYSLQEWQTCGGQVCTRTPVCSHLFGKTSGSVSCCGELVSFNATLTHSRWEMLRSLLFTACEIEGRSQAGRGSCGSAPWWQVGYHCGSPVGQNRGQCGVQRAGLWYCQGRLARSLHGSRWERSMRFWNICLSCITQFQKGFAYLLLISDAPSAQANQIMTALVRLSFCLLHWNTVSFSICDYTSLMPGPPPA